MDRAAWTAACRSRLLTDGMLPDDAGRTALAMACLQTGPVSTWPGPRKAVKAFWKSVEEPRPPIDWRGMWRQATGWISWPLVAIAWSLPLMMALTFAGAAAIEHAWAGRLELARQAATVPAASAAILALLWWRAARSLKT